MVNRNCTCSYIYHFWPINEISIDKSRTLRLFETEVSTNTKSGFMMVPIPGTSQFDFVGQAESIHRNGPRWRRETGWPFPNPYSGCFFLDLGRGLYMLNLEYKAVVGSRQLLNTTPEKNEKQWDLYTQI